MSKVLDREDLVLLVLGKDKILRVLEMSEENQKKFSVDIQGDRLSIPAPEQVRETQKGHLETYNQYPGELIFLQYTFNKNSIVSIRYLSEDTLLGIYDRTDRGQLNQMLHLGQEIALLINEHDRAKLGL